jgi:hypothetical protein
VARDRPSRSGRSREVPPPESRARAAAARESDVILDVEFDAGLLFLVVRNLGDLPAYAVRIKLDPAIKGLGGSRVIGRLGLFRRLEFLAPQKSIRLLLDRSSLYFARDEPTTVEATIRWRTRSGERRSEVVRHDLEIYRDLPYAESEVDV